MLKNLFAKTNNKLQNWLLYMKKKVWLPMQRKHKTPHYLARSNAVGMSLAFAPFPGQIPVVFALWMICKRTNFRFSLSISVAWTFISNVFTNLPLFYLYYITGNLLLGTGNNLSYNQWQNMFGQNFGEAIKILGSRFLLGSFFYMVIFGCLGYFLALRKHKS